MTPLTDDLGLWITGLYPVNVSQSAWDRWGAASSQDERTCTTYANFVVAQHQLNLDNTKLPDWTTYEPLHECQNDSKYTKNFKQDMRFNRSHSWYQPPTSSNEIHSLVFSLEGRVWQEPEPSHVTGMALAHCILGKFLEAVCHGLQKTPENAHPIVLRSNNVNCYNSPPDSVPLLPEQSASTRNRIVSSESIPHLQIQHTAISLITETDTGSMTVQKLPQNFKCIKKSPPTYFLTTCCMPQQM